MSAKPKQRQIPVGVCEHNVTDEILTEGGSVMGLRCAGCTKVLGGFGTCVGCHTHKLLTILVAKTGERFCTGDCRAEWAKEKRKATELKPRLGVTK